MSTFFRLDFKWETWCAINYHTSYLWTKLFMVQRRSGKLGNGGKEEEKEGCKCDEGLQEGGQAELLGQWDWREVWQWRPWTPGAVCQTIWQPDVFCELIWSYLDAAAGGPPRMFFSLSSPPASLFPTQQTLSWLQTLYSQSALKVGQSSEQIPVRLWSEHCCYRLNVVWQEVFLKMKLNMKYEVKVITGSYRIGFNF